MITVGELLASHTTLKVGGEAEYFSVISSKEELIEAVTEAKKNNWSLRVLGGGSNVLVSDGGIKGLVIKNSLTGLSSETINDQIELTVGAGEILDAIIGHSVTQGWWGLENLSHIPGTIGATPVQNVGAYGVEVKDLIKQVEVFDTESMEFKILSNEDCGFSYRHSIFKTEPGKNLIVTSVTFLLSPTPNPKISYKDLSVRFSQVEPSQAAIRSAVIEIRSKKFPDWHQVGTAGSFFKNPIITKTKYSELQERHPELPAFNVSDTEVKLPLGWILDRLLQVRGIRVGNVGTYEGQALVVVNEGGATAEEIAAFANSIVSEVKNKIGVAIEWEVTKW